MKASQADNYSEKEAAQRRDETIKRMLNTPPKPHNQKKTKAKKLKSKRNG